MKNFCTTLPFGSYEVPTNLKTWPLLYIGTIRPFFLFVGGSEPCGG